jgi:hypothetical protein
VFPQKQWQAKMYCLCCGLLIVGCLIWSPVILGTTRPSAVVPFVFLQQYLMLLGAFCIDVNFGKTLVNKRIADKKISFFYLIYNIELTFI